MAWIQNFYFADPPTIFLDTAVAKLSAWSNFGYPVFTKEMYAAAWMYFNLIDIQFLQISKIWTKTNYTPFDIKAWQILLSIKLLYEYTISYFAHPPTILMQEIRSSWFLFYTS